MSFSSLSAFSGRSGRSGEWVLGRVGGVPVVVSATSLLLGLVIAASWWPTVSRALGFPGMLTVFGVVVATVVGVALSVLLHELAHGLAGTLLGRRPVRYELYLWGGRTSFGPASSSWAPWRDAVTSLSGPALNLALWAAGGRAQEVLWEGGAWSGPVSTAVWVLTWVNLALAVFNSLPGLPLDGGHALAAVVTQLSGDQRLGLRTAAWGGVAVVTAMAWWWILRPVVLHGQRLDSLSLALVALVGWSIASTSWQVLGTDRRARAAASLDLRALSRPVVVTDATTPVTEVQSLLDRAVLVLVTDGSRLLGGIDAVTLTDLGLTGTAGQAGPAPGEGAETGHGSGAASVTETITAGITAGQVCTVLPAVAVTTSLTGQDAVDAMKAARAVSRWLVLVESGTMSGAVPTGAQ